MRRLLLAGAAAVLTAAALLLGGVFSPAGDARPVSAAALDRQGDAFAQRARQTGDARYYASAEAAYRRALSASPNDLAATIGLAALANSRHEFRSALALGRRAISLSPSTARTYGVVGDALVELGRYDEAFTAFNRMVSLKPSVASYARVSYARELLGDVAGAADAMQLAIDSAVGDAEAIAWSRTQLGKLFWSNGRPRAAAREYRAALAVRPGYVYALEALAKVEAARGDLRRAIVHARRAAEVQPLPQFVVTLGDLLRQSGREGQAQRQYALVRTIFKLQRAGGVKLDLEAALFELEHGDARRGLELARAARAARPSIDGDDVLAWALARHGRCAEALTYSKRALRLGTRDATKLAHRSLIERCLR